MSKVMVSAGAAALSLAGLSACATPEPRYPVAMDPLGAQVAAAPEPETAPAVEAEAAPAPAEPIVETPRAAPVGRVETATLAQLAPAQTTPLAEAVVSPDPPTAAESVQTHLVGPGDTFYAIARRYGVGPQAVAEVNGLSFADTLKLGQRVRLPAAARDRGPAAARAFQPTSSEVPPLAPAPAVVQVALQPPAVSEPAPPVVIAPPLTAPPPPVVVAPRVSAPVTPPSDAAPAPSTQAAPPSSAPVPAVTPPPSAPFGTASAPAVPGRGVFVWPLRGDVISRFGPRAMGQRGDGVNIAAAEGDPVRAAAAGTVVYAGDQVKGGFGKLVLIEHADRWFTVYAHLSDITVRMRQKVTQNQQLGRAGRTGNVGSPQLYFEVRNAPVAGERARPVDPLPLLPE